MREKTVELTFVQCDEDGCGWRTDVTIDNFADWKNKPCPKCSKGVILTEEEVVKVGLVIVTGAVMDALDPEGKKPRTTITVSSARGLETRAKHAEHRAARYEKQLRAIREANISYQDFALLYRLAEMGGDAKELNRLKQVVEKLINAIEIEGEE